MGFGDLLDAILQINRNANGISGAPALAIGRGATTAVKIVSAFEYTRWTACSTFDIKIDATGLGQATGQGRATTGQSLDGLSVDVENIVSRA